MRGALGDLVCTEGDTNYDLSKVYQSLCGYDFFILDKDIDVNAAKMLGDLEQVKYESHFLFSYRSITRGRDLSLQEF